jgi:microcystin-dependent protein
MGAAAAAGRLTTATITIPDGLGGVGGTQQHTLTTAQMPSHSHPINIRTAGPSTSTAAQGNGSLASTNTGSAGGGQPHPNVQPTIVTNYIIKT